MVTARRTVVTLALGGLFSCAADPTTRPRTELVLLADTDIAELTHVEFEVRGEGHATELRRAAVRDDGAALSVGLVRTSGPLGPLTASAHGYAGDTELVARHVVVSFVEGRTLVVPLHLLRDCVGVACGADESCTESGCEARALPSSSLPEWPSLPPDIVIGELPTEAGAPDGAAPDAGPPDAGPPDAGPPDAGPPDAGVNPLDGSVVDDAATADAGDGAVDDAAIDLDATLDATVDGATDAATDAALDAATDAALDAATDAALDAATDAALDAATDAGTSCSGTAVDLTSDPNHCGSCTTVCQPTYIYLYHDVPACKNSTCTWACAPLYADCNGTQVPFLDRCETYLGTDEDNCGACGKKCSSSETCISGVCTK